eukprot:g4583.t1
MAARRLGGGSAVRRPGREERLEKLLNSGAYGGAAVDDSASLLQTTEAYRQHQGTTAETLSDVGYQTMTAEKAQEVDRARAKRLPAAWATAVGHTSDPVDVLKQQLREAQSAHDELLQQMKVAEGTWRRCIEEAEQKEAAAKKELQGCKALLEKQRPRRSLELSRFRAKKHAEVKKYLDTAEVDRKMIEGNWRVILDRIEEDLAFTRKYVSDSEGFMGLAKKVACVSMTDALLEIRAKIERAHSMLEFYRKRWKEKDDDLQLLSRDPTGALAKERQRREIRDAQQGFVIKKVTEKHGKTEVRRVAVCPNTCVLKWCHVEESFGPTSKSVDLQTVQRLDFGPSARAAKLFPEVMPWLCFSVITGERSYDFIGSNESSTRCFVLCISRLCEKFAGGTFRTRHDFEVAKGWCKLKTGHGCQRRGRTLLQEFLTSVQHVGATLPPPVQPPVVELAGAAEKTGPWRPQGRGLSM